MWLAVGYLLLVGIAAVFVFMGIHEDRRKYLVSAVDPLVEDLRPPYSPLPLRVVLLWVGFLALIDGVIVSFLLPPVLLSAVEGGSRAGPGSGVHLLNLAFDLLVLRAVWSCWRRDRSWLLVGIGLSTGALVLLVTAGAGLGLPRWYSGRYLGSPEAELYSAIALFAAWILLAVWTLFHLDSGTTGNVSRDGELAGRSEPLSESERVRVRWARGEMTDGERDAVLADLLEQRRLSRRA